jgi:hypothetical protein
MWRRVHPPLIFYPLLSLLELQLHGVQAPDPHGLGRAQLSGRPQQRDQGLLLRPIYFLPSLLGRIGHIQKFPPSFLYYSLSLFPVLFSSPIPVSLPTQVADFGLTRRLAEGSSTWHSEKVMKLPVKWCSIEALDDRTFSEASDVWAFGVVMWEVCIPTVSKKMWEDKGLSLLQMRLFFFFVGQSVMLPPPPSPHPHTHTTGDGIR